jgi:quercetin dioxygenase-like cupin family protein
MKSSGSSPAERPAVFDLAQAPQPGPGIVSQTLLDASPFRVVRFSLGIGECLTEHTSTRAVWIQILAGTADFTMEGQHHALTAGDGVWMPAHTPHAVTALSPLIFLLLLARPEALTAVPITLRRPSGESAANNP